MESTDQATDRSQSEAVERLHDQLTESLTRLVTSEDWQRALAVATRFHDYSFANTQLIWSQAVARGFTPSRVAGYRTWQQLGRQVRRGERGLGILAPVIRKVTPEDGVEEEPRVVGFRAVGVFDIAQTDGEPLPEVRAALLEGDLPAHWDQVSELITGADFDLQVADLDRLGDANGITDWAQRQVVVRASLPGAQRFKTAVHELAHIRLHEPTSEGRPNCRGIVEVEAESVAYMVCAALGIDSASYSLPYVASWSGGDVDKVAATANRVIGCARQVLTQLEHHRRLEQEPAPIENTVRVEARDRQVWDMAIEPVRLPDRTADLEAVLRSATSFYQGQLRHDQVGAHAQALLKRRGFTAETASRWQLGYAPPTWNALTDALRREGFSEEVMLGAGLVGRAHTGRLYDLMRGRVIFPVFDQNGAPRGFAGRLVTGDGPKYLNGPETDLYTKRSLLYGLHLAKPAIAKADQAVIVEGYTDAIAAHQAGITNAVATGGTALTTEHLEALSRTTGNVTLAFDGDSAGLQAAQRSIEHERATDGVHLRVARLPAGHDPAELLADSKTELLHDAIDNAIPLIHHLIDQLIERHNLEEPEGRVRALRGAAPIINPLNEPTERAKAVAYLANRIGRDEALIQDALHRYASSPQRWRQQAPGRSLA